MAQPYSRTLEDSFSWATNLSRTRLSSIDGLSLRTSHATAAIGDLQGVLHTVQELGMRQIPHRELKEIVHLGEGETFTVSKNQWKDQIVAVKYLRRSLLEEQNSGNVTRRQMQSVLREILIMHHPPLAEHPNITSVHGYGWQMVDTKPSPYIVVEYGTQGCLRQFLRARPGWQIRNKLILAGDIAAGLMSLHSVGIVHGDLKLDNVVISYTLSRPSMSIAKICDFGHSLSTGEDEKSGYYYGTPLYLPPEALGQKEKPIASIDLPRCDIWAFGLALWEILIDGQTFFEEAWRENMELARSTLSSGSFEIVEQPIASTVANSDEGMRDLMQSQSASTYFGQFDLSNLQKLSQHMLTQVCPSHTFQRGYLGPLLRRSLDPNPLKRILDLSRTPIMNEWRAAAPQSALQTRLALHTRSSEVGFMMFQPDRQADIPWEHQVEMVADLEASISKGEDITRLSSSAFQLMICCALGFGCEVDFARVYQHMRKAVELHSTIATWLTRNLTSVCVTTLETQTEPFSVILTRGFSSQLSFDQTSAIALKEISESESVEPLANFPSTAHGQATGFLSQVLQHLERPELFILRQTVIYNNIQGISFSWLEFAILSDDLHLLTICCKQMGQMEGDTLSRSGVFGETPLNLACRKGRHRMVELLLQYGADPLQTAADGCTILHWLFCLADHATRILVSVLKRHRKLRSLIDGTCAKVHRMHPQWPTELTGTPLAFATIAGDHKLVQKLLECGADPCHSIEFPPSLGKELTSLWTPIHLAVKYNHPEIVKDLCSAQIKKSGGIHSNFAFLHYEKFQIAAALGFLTPVERHGVHGCDGHERLQKTLHHLPNATLFWQSTEGINPLWQAMDYENIEVVAALLYAAPRLAETNINDPNDLKSRMLPLHYACEISGRRNLLSALAIPKLVLKAYRAGLDARDDRGRTALHLSVSATYANTTKWLIEQGANVNATDSFGRTPLMLSRSARSTKVLLEAGATSTQKDIDGLTCAHHYAFRGDLALLQLLIDRKLDINSITKSGATPLHLAVAGSSRACVDELCRTSVPINSVDSNGDSALHLAIRLKRGDLVRLLIESGADVGATSSQGMSPLTLAVKQATRYDSLKLDTFDTDESIQILDAVLAAGVSDNRDLGAQGIFMDRVLRLCTTPDSHNPVVRYIFAHRQLQRPLSDALRGHSYTLLHEAAKQLSFGMAELLFNYGVDPDRRDADNNTPLIICCLCHCTNSSLPTQREHTALNPKEEFVSLLIDHSTNTAAKNSRGQTAWSIACERNDYEIMTQLLYDMEATEADIVLADSPITLDMLDDAVHRDCAPFVRACFSVHSGRIPFLKDPKQRKKLERSVCRPESSMPVVDTIVHLTYRHLPLLSLAFRGESIVHVLEARYAYA